MATPEELKDLDSVLDRIREANQALYKTVDKELRTIIQAQLTELKLEKDLIMAKIDVRKNVDGAQERVTCFQKALDALRLSAAAPGLVSIRRRLEKLSSDLGKTVDKELRTAIQA